AAVVRLAERAVTGRPRSAVALTALGAALVRAGQADKAVEPLREAVTVAAETPSAWLFLALAEQCRGQAAAAREALATATKTGGAAAPRSWQQREEWRVLRAEAEALLNVPSGMSKPH